MSQPIQGERADMTRLSSPVTEALRATIPGDKADNVLPTRPIVDVYDVMYWKSRPITTGNCLVTSKHTSYMGN